MADHPPTTSRHLTALSGFGQLFSPSGARLVGRLCLLGLGLGAVLYAATDLGAPRWAAAAIAGLFALRMLFDLLPGLRTVLQPDVAGLAALLEDLAAGPASLAGGVMADLQAWVRTLRDSPLSPRFAFAPAAAQRLAGLDPYYLVVLGAPGPETHTETVPFVTTACRSAPRVIEIVGGPPPGVGPYQARVYGPGGVAVWEARSPTPRFEPPRDIPLEPGRRYLWEVTPAADEQTLASGVFWLLPPSDLQELSQAESALGEVYGPDARDLAHGVLLADRCLFDEAITAARDVVRRGPSTRSVAAAHVLLAMTYRRARTTARRELADPSAEIAWLTEAANAELTRVYEVLLSGK